VTQDPAVLSFDRRQRGTFNKTFEQYVSTRVGPGRIKTGKAMLQRHASLLARIQQRFGVPPEIVVAIWGLESDFGKGDIGKMPVIRTLTTMAHDCRRTELFQGELLAALKILQRGDLPLRDLIGAYAGELGQTQFLPSSYIKYGVDFDGNGHVDLRHSIPDVLASTANLKTAGFRGGQPYGEGTANFEAMREWNRAPSTARPSAISRISPRGAVVSLRLRERRRRARLTMSPTSLPSRKRQADRAPCPSLNGSPFPHGLSGPLRPCGSRRRCMSSRRPPAPS
jgi:membrane-bound lytic murein transglycosylase B